MKLLAVLALLAPSVLPAQRPAATTGAVTGTVLVAATGQPLPGAAVVLEATSDAALVTPTSGAFMGRSMTAITDQDGSYRFAGLQAGTYRLIVRHLGFHPASVQVDLGQAEAFRVSVGLIVNPILLQPMDARATTGDPYGRMRNADEEARFGRLDAEQFRDQRFLEGDAAVLTHQDVVEAVTLGETDLFRALQRLPGVSTRDDFNASLWTRGAPWSQTRVYFDGMPLFNPVHAIGVLSGVNPDAIGTASFHPGVRPVSIGEGAAAVLNVSTRPATFAGTRGLAELSVTSARAALDWGARTPGTGFSIAARRSYVDLVTRLAESLGADSGTYFPFDFFDVTARGDARLGRSTLQASGMWQQDGVRGDVPDLLRATQGHWGNRIGRVTLIAPFGPWRSSTSLGISNFQGVVSSTLTTPPESVLAERPSHAPMRNTLTVISAGTTFSPSDGSVPWQAGVQLSHQRQSYDGQYPRPYPVITQPQTLRLDERLNILAVFAERRIGLGHHAAIEVGLRAEAHEGVRNAFGMALAPKISGRVTPPGSRVTFTAGAARSYQYSQALAPAGPSVGPDLYVTDVWLLAGDTIPAVRADIVTAGAEAWLGAGWVAAINVFGRRATGVVVPEPDSGPTTVFRPIFVSAENRAHGVELSARRLVGRWTGSVSYTIGRSIMRAPSGFAFNGGEIFEYPTSADRRHAFDASAMVRLGRSWRVGTALSAASGAPYSRFTLGCDTGGTCQSTDSLAVGVDHANALRAPGYAALDVLVDWSKDLGRVRIGAYLQVRNLLNLANAVTYTGTIGCAAPNPPTLRFARFAPDNSMLCDRFDKGVPILPLGGIRIAF